MLFLSKTKHSGQGLCYKIDYFCRLCAKTYNWGRPDLTGCVLTCVSMQAHGMRALKDGSKQ